jgi:hypothetical protein
MTTEHRYQEEESGRVVHFDADVVMADDGALIAVRMTCSECGAVGYRSPAALLEHAQEHR